MKGDINPEKERGIKMYCYRKKVIVVLKVARRVSRPLTRDEVVELEQIVSNRILKLENRYGQPQIIVENIIFGEEKERGE